MKRFLPTREAIVQSRWLRWLGPRLHDPCLWQLNRRSVAKGVAIGMFFGLMIPVAQIPAAAIVALIFRGNLWVAAVATLVSNPFTYAPLYILAYQIGGNLVGFPNPDRPGAVLSEAPDFLEFVAFISTWITGVGAPLIVGMGLMALVGGVLGFVGTHWVWRLRVLKKRRLRPQANAPKTLI
jgi:uncharacterized protein